MNIRKAATWLVAILAGFAAAMFTHEALWHAEDANRCDYRFAWSGRCVRPMHHSGSHY